MFFVSYYDVLILRVRVHEGQNKSLEVTETHYIDI